MKKIIALFMAVCVLSGTIVTQAVADKVASTDNSKNNSIAWATLGNTIESNNMTFFDGGQTDSSSSTYNEKVYIEDVEARKFYGGNHAYFRLDESFYNVKEDHDFFINLTFYQFGPARGTFTFQYASTSGTKAITIWKEADPMWVTKQIYLGDANFNHSIDDLKADIKIVSGAYNAFAKLEVINAKSIKYDNDFSVGIVAQEHATTLSQLGLYSTDSKDPTGDLEKPLTRASAAAKIVRLIGRQNEAYKYNAQISGATDVENQAIGYLNSKGYVNWTDGATMPVSQTELTAIFASIAGIPTQGDVIQNAIDKSLLFKSDMFMQPNKTANEDNLVALGYNWLMLTGKNGKLNIVNMMDNRLILENKLKEVNEAKIQALYYSTPRVLDRQEVVDSTTGRKYYHVDRGSQLVRDYYTANNWLSDNKRFIITDEDGGGQLYLYDTQKNTLQFVCYGNNPVVSKKTDNLYFTTTYDGGDRKLKRINLNTFKMETVTDMFPTYNGGWGSSLTNDEKYFAINAVEQASELDLRKPFGGFRQRRTPICNLETGEWDLSYHKEFMGSMSDGTVLNHVILNPEYDNLVFFAHEGTAELTADRIWLLDTNTNKAFNLFRQKQRTETITGEPAGHEMWFGDGNRLGFVKYPKDTNLAYSGIMTVDLTGRHKEYVNSDYRYWHCCASPANDRFIVADTNNIVGGTIEVVLVDRYTGEAHLLCKPLLGKTVHPGHAHPSFSQDGRKVSFVVNNGSGVIATAWMDVSDIVDKPANGSRISISDELEVPSYKDCENYIEPTTKDKADCYKVPSGKKMLVNLKDEVFQGERVDATISFSYYDAGFTPIKLSYFGWNEKSSFIDKTELMKLEIQRNNTKKWKTYTAKLSDINLDNMEHIGTDFRVEGVYADLYIKDLKVEVTNIIEKFIDERPLMKYYFPDDE